MRLMKLTTAFSLQKMLVAPALICIVLLTAGNLSAASKISQSLGDVDGGLIVVIGCGEAATPEVAAELAAGGNSLVHVIAGSQAEVDAVNKAAVAAGVKGCVTVEQLGVAKLPYRDYMVNGLVVMDLDKAEKAGLDEKEVERCIAPMGKMVLCKGGQ